MIRTITAYAISPVLRLTGFRFSKDYRWGVTRFHRAVYAMVDTVTANYAGGMKFSDIAPGDDIVIFKKD